MKYTVSPCTCSDATHKAIHVYRPHVIRHNNMYSAIPITDGHSVPQLLFQSIINSSTFCGLESQWNIICPSTQICTTPKINIINDAETIVSRLRQWHHSRMKGHTNDKKSAIKFENNRLNQAQKQCFFHLSAHTWDNFLPYAVPYFQ